MEHASAKNRSLSHAGGLLSIFAVTYFGMALGRLMGLRIDGTDIAVVGAVAVVTAGALPQRQALGAIDDDTLIVLFAMMVVSAQFGAAGSWRNARRCSPPTFRRGGAASRSY